MPKTVIENVVSPHSAVKVLKIGGTLGFHEKDTLTRILRECEKRGIANLVIDFSTLTSLGGGCARIMRDAANSGAIAIGVAGASETTLKFLQTKDGSCRIYFADSIDEAISFLAGGAGGEEALQPDRETASAIEPPRSGGKDDMERSDVGTVGPDPSLGGAEGLPKVICLGHDGDTHPAEATAVACEAPADQNPPAPPVQDTGACRAEAQKKTKSPGGSRLAKKLFHYDALLSISSEFNHISDAGRLLDTFLLTSIAQVGVEHAAFFELQDIVMTPVAARGIELDQCAPFDITGTVWDEFPEGKSQDIVELAEGAAGNNVQERLRLAGFVWAVPFLVHEDLRGLVLLGKPIKNSLDSDSFEIMKILIHHASIAYKNIRRFEEESYRTLGLIQTLISLIEENTLAQGSTSFVANYSYVLAKKMNYPEEQLRDLIFGVVLRDIGMIKVSDLILRNPRELDNEEWEIIKQHPSDGADMLKKMRFSNVAVDIVLYHHERYNGEGYPNQLRGKQIPLGARIVSVVESFAAMLQNRPIRPALPQEEALNAIRENWGIRYDPDVVRNFVEIIEEEIRTGQKVQYTDNELFKNRGDLACRKAFS
jgi:hypothetical protein